MKRSHILYGAAAVALLGLNAWRWLPAQAEQEAAPLRRQQLLSTDGLVLRVTAVASVPAPVRRDLFQERAAPVAARPQARTDVVKPTEPPQKSAEELELERIQAEFDSIKVIAIVFQDGVGQAFMSLAGDSQIVRVGDALGERLTVKAISVDAVDLEAADGGVDGRIALTGS